MSRMESPPWDRGASFYNGEAIDQNELGGVNLEGREYEFEDDIFGTGQIVRVRVVRNSTDHNIKPKKMVTLEKTGHFGKRVDAYADTLAASNAFPADELLPAAGVPTGDLFYVVVQGPATVLTSDAGVAINEGDVLVCATAANTNAAGKVEVQTLTGATAALANQIQNRLGIALEARTVGQTGADLKALIGY